ncbi:hypothetical protein Nepgr_016336 [Nepenthes gracilis]|uniref:Uncharacterized protein n=1 Tax=Nepenthes gracilis TaxID=150966 RepID=A0AAD3SMI1_NEPGR|nr:hypothetical protein Nepgr_016336 [Nepenthes gracilis]
MVLKYDTTCWTTTICIGKDHVPQQIAKSIQAPQHLGQFRSEGRLQFRRKGAPRLQQYWSISYTAEPPLPPLAESSGASSAHKDDNANSTHNSAVIGQGSYCTATQNRKL